MGPLLECGQGRPNARWVSTDQDSPDATTGPWQLDLDMPRFFERTGDDRFALIVLKFDAENGAVEIAACKQHGVAAIPVKPVSSGAGVCKE